MKNYTARFTEMIQNGNQIVVRKQERGWPDLVNEELFAGLLGDAGLHRVQFAGGD